MGLICPITFVLYPALCMPVSCLIRQAVSPKPAPRQAVHRRPGAGTRDIRRRRHQEQRHRGHVWPVRQVRGKNHPKDSPYHPHTQIRTDDPGEFIIWSHLPILVTGALVSIRTRLRLSAVALAFDEMRTPYPSGQEICVQNFGNAYQWREIETRMTHFKSTLSTGFIKRFREIKCSQNNARFPFTILAFSRRN